MSYPTVLIPTLATPLFSTSPPDIYMFLNHKIAYSIAIIKETEKLALQLDKLGYTVAFSGGKDSQVIYELAKMSGVKFKAVFNKTSVDPPELLAFIKTVYPDVSFNYPTETMFELIVRLGFLPMRKKAFCCSYLKERTSNNTVAMVGIRKTESFSRSKREELIDSCTKKYDKFIFSPILDWSEQDVWNFIKLKKLSYCCLYDQGFSRIGCIGCPMNLKRQKIELNLYPNIYKMYYNAVKKLMQKGRYQRFSNPKQVLDWWQSGLNQRTFLNLK
jgi:phosphoadenosine phosphosulfate reductase